MLKKIFYHRDNPKEALEVIKSFDGGLRGYFLLIDQFGDTIKASSNQLKCDDRWNMFGTSPKEAYEQKTKYLRILVEKSINEMNNYTNKG